MKDLFPALFAIALVVVGLVVRDGQALQQRHRDAFEITTETQTNNSELKS